MLLELDEVEVDADVLDESEVVLVDVPVLPEVSVEEVLPRLSVR